METKNLVKCCWCEWEGTVELGEEICPNCKRKGHLAWQNINQQEVEVEE